MPRKATDTRLENRTARLKLQARHAPYWRNIHLGRAIGYRRNAAGKSGTWQARSLSHDADGKRLRKFEAIGTADDMFDADGVNILTFAQAQEAATKWFEKISRAGGRVIEPVTVANAITDYVEDYLARGGKDGRGLKSTISAHITPKLGAKKAADLTRDAISKWHKALAAAAPRRRTSVKLGKKKAIPQPVAADNADGQRARRASANRILTVLKAALNLAYDNEKIASPEAWRRVKPFKNADAPRIRNVTDGEIKRIVNATGEEFRPMVQAALLSGARYGEIVRLRAGDLNASAALLHIRPGKTNKARDVALTDEGLKFFKLQAAGKASNTLLLPQPNGEPWGKSYQIRPMKAACRAANVTPAIGFHILRHAYASRLVMAGVPLGAVAKQIGDSEVTTAKHYAHHSPKSVADAVRNAVSDLGIVPDSNVVALNT